MAGCVFRTVRLMAVMMRMTESLRDAGRMSCIFPGMAIEIEYCAA